MTEQPPQAPQPPKVKYFKLPPDVASHILTCIAELPGKVSFEPMQMMQRLEPVHEVIVPDLPNKPE